MKKYALIITCLAMLNGALLAQTSGGSSSGGSSSGGTGSSSSGSSVTEPSGAGTSGTGASGSSSTSVGGAASSATNGSAVIDASGAATQTPGVITIQGVVTSDTEKQQIERQLRQISGVTEVRNMLRVSGAGSSSGQSPSETPDSKSNP